MEFFENHDTLNRRVVQLNICDLPDLPVRCGCNIFFPGCKKCSVTFSGGHWKLRQCGEHLGRFWGFFTVSLLVWILVNLDYTKKTLPSGGRGTLKNSPFRKFFSLHGTSNPTPTSMEYTQLAIYKWYILPIGWLYITYHLWREPEKAIGNKPHQLHFELIMFCFGVIKLMRLWVVHPSKVARKNQNAKKNGGWPGLNNKNLRWEFGVKDRSELLKPNCKAFFQVTTRFFQGFFEHETVIILLLPS